MSLRLERQNLALQALMNKWFNQLNILEFLSSSLIFAKGTPLSKSIMIPGELQKFSPALKME